MILIDTSAWIAVYRDKTGGLAKRLAEMVGEDRVATTDCIICELLQGTSTQREWASVLRAAEALVLLPLSADDWIESARNFYDLQRRSITIRSTLDCCIAQLALRTNSTLLHVDKDFERIATARPLKLLRLDTV